MEPVFLKGKGTTPSYPSQLHGEAGSTATHAGTPLMPYVPLYQPRVGLGEAITPATTQQGPRRPLGALTPIRMTAPSIVGTKALPLKPLSPPYPRSYNPNTRCDYHGKAVGHATERCWSLKHKVQDLLDGGLLDFQDQGSNVQNNPHSVHRGVAVSAISH
ncbi:hypothetical protein CR513_38867, partial [Mucuna pruriens]